MDTAIVNLKNLYRILKEKDYPIYSNGVLSRSGQSGLTLIKFWKQLLLYRWRNTKHGKMIWRTEGSRNRYHSELCNRKEEFPFYKEYTKEILAACSEKEILQQIQAFADFLESRKYSSQAFRRKLEYFLKEARKEDPEFQKDAAPYFLEILAACDQWMLASDFVDGWFLTMLCLHAIAGTEMNGSDLRSLRRNSRYLPASLASLQEEKSSSVMPPVQIVLTVQDGEMWSKALYPEHFYGREEELYDLQDALHSKRKLLISGMGGIGKTELLRQFLRVSRRGPLRIATIQYENSLIESFAREFQNLTRSNARERFLEAVYQLSQEDPGRQTVVLIDNMNNMAEDPKVWEILADLPCAVFVTSRLKSIPGFETWEVSELDLEASALVFRNNYRKVLTGSEKTLLQNFLDKERIRHPLTLTLLGRYAGSCGYSMEDLLRVYPDFRAADGELAVAHAAVNRQFHDVYKNMYSRAVLEGSEQKLVHLLAILPYRSFRADELMEYAGLKEKDFLPAVERLCQEGWLEQTEHAYTMHPIIAESVQKRNPSEEDYLPLWKALHKRIGYDLNSYFNSTSEQVETALLFLQAADRYGGAVSESLAILTGQCGLLLWNSKYAGVDMVNLVERILDRCSLPSTEVQFYREYLNLKKERGHIETCEQLLKEQKAHPGIPDIMLQSFSAALAVGCSYLGEYEKALQICEEMLQTPLSDYNQGQVFAAKGMCLNHMGRMEEANAFCEQMLSQILGKDKTAQRNYIGALCLMGDNAFWLGQMETAQKSLHLLKEIVNPEQMDISERILYLNLSGNLAQQEGRLSDAASMQEQILKLLDIYVGGRSPSQIAAMEKLAIIYNKMGEGYREKSWQYHQQVIQMQEKLHPDSTDLQVFLNNYAVSLLDGGRYDDALPILQKACQMAEGMPEISLAEPIFQMSRVWRGKGDPKQELDCLQKAYPVFLESYGAEHPKTKQAKERLEELKQQP